MAKAKARWKCIHVGARNSPRSATEPGGQAGAGAEDRRASRLGRRVPGQRAGWSAGVGSATEMQRSGGELGCGGGAAGWRLGRLEKTTA
jgi:hypothetical protein